MSSTEATQLPPLYSKGAITGFAVLFSPIAGAVLLARNFKTLGRPDVARKTLWVSIVCMALLLTAASFLPEQAGSSSIGVGIGLAGGYALNAYADKILGDRSVFPTKKIWKPLLICLLIFIPLVALIIYAGTE